MTQKLRYFCTLLLVAVASVAWADEETIDFTAQGYENAQAVTETTGTVVKATFTNGGTPTAYYTTGEAVRVYNGGTMSITANGNTITKIEYTYVLNGAATATVAGKNSEGTYDSGTKTWTGSDTEVVLTAGTAKHVRISQVVVTYTAGDTDAPSISADNVNIAYDATGGEIEYTIENPVTGTSLEANTAADWVSNINVGASSITFSTTENEGNAARVATFILTYEGAANKNVTVTQAGNPNAPGTENNPYTVAQARAAIDANTGVTGVYATGIVSEIVTPLNTQYGNITYNISADGTTTADQLQAYRGKSYEGGNFTSEDDIKVGDEVVVYGNLKKYGETYEFDQNNQLVSLNRPVSEDPAVTLDDYTIDVPVEGANGILTVQYQNIDDVVAGVQFYDENGNEVGADYYEVWLTASLDDDNNVNYIAIENYGEARTAYFKVFASVGNDNDYYEFYSDMITITQAAYVPKWIVSFDTDGGTFVPNDDFAEEIVEVEQGTHYLPSATKDGYRLDGWNDGDATYAAGCGYDVTGDVEFTAVWVEKGVEEWVKTDISELEEGDVFVIVGNNGSDYAMTNDNGAANPPATVAVTVEDEKITSEVADNMMWNISGDATNGYTFYPNGDSEKWLYCTAANNGVRVGTNTNKTFTISEEGYLFNSATSRYVGIYNSADWRCYTSINNNIKDQTFAFYKKVETYPASTVKLTIKENFTATTFSSDKALDFTGFETLKAYIITDGEGTTSQVWKVPAGEGLYVEGEAGDYDVPILVDETQAEDMTGNLLVGTISDPVNTKTLEGDYTYYLFGKQNGKEAFFKVGESTSDAKATASAGKAYLAVPGAGNAKEMIVIGGDVTGIESIENGTIVNDNYYTIDGKLVKGQPTQKGIYVVNGRKVVIK